MSYGVEKIMHSSLGSDSAIVPFDMSLSTLLPFLREPLLSADKLERAALLARSLPATFNSFYLECRLSPPRGEIDVLAAAGHPASPPNRLESASLHPFVSGWLAGTVAPSIPFIWLERDDAPEITRHPLGNTHVCVDVDYRAWRGSAGGRQQESVAFEPHTARAILAQMAAHELLSPSQVATTELCLASLPPSGRLIHVSSMQARSPAELKLFLALPRSTAAEFLVQLGAPGFLEQLKALETWSGAEPNGSHLFCDLTFRGTKSHRLALVFSHRPFGEVRGDASLGLVRSRLLREGLCTVSQDAALAAWMSPPLDPVCQADTARRVRRWLEIKVSSARGISSKAYLGFSPVLSLF